VQYRSRPPADKTLFFISSVNEESTRSEVAERLNRCTCDNYKENDHHNCYVCHPHCLWGEVYYHTGLRKNKVLGVDVIGDNLQITATSRIKVKSVWNSNSSVYDFVVLRYHFIIRVCWYVKLLNDIYCIKWLLDTYLAWFPAELWITFNIAVHKYTVTVSNMVWIIPSS